VVVVAVVVVCQMRSFLSSVGDALVMLCSAWQATSDVTQALILEFFSAGQMPTAPSCASSLLHIHAKCPPHPHAHLLFCTSMPNAHRNLMHIFSSAYACQMSMAFSCASSLQHMQAKCPPHPQPRRALDLQIFVSARTGLMPNASSSA